MARSPMNPETRAQARSLFDRGLSRNAIARELDLDPATITRWARSEGIEFDRAAVGTANRAHRVDLAASRLRLAEQMMANGHESLAMLNDPFVVFSFGGKENTYAEHTLTQAPMEARRSAQMIAGVAFDKATKVLEKTPDGLDRAESLVDHLERFFDTAGAADGE